MPHESRSREYDRRYVRALWVGLAVSLALHVGLFLWFGAEPLPRMSTAAAGDPGAEPTAAAGGGMRAIELRPPATAPPEPVPDPEAPEAVEPEEVEPQPDPPSDLPPIELQLAASVSGSTDEAGPPGEVSATGSGSAGASAEGEEGVVPPWPRGQIMPPTERPADLRGAEVDVWVFVGRDGRVVADSTRLDPPTGDRGFDRRLKERAADWRFDPGTRNGRPVGAWFRYTIIL